MAFDSDDIAILTFVNHIFFPVYIVWPYFSNTKRVLCIFVKSLLDEVCFCNCEVIVIKHTCILILLKHRLVLS